MKLEAFCEVEHEQLSNVVAEALVPNEYFDMTSIALVRRTEPTLHYIVYVQDDQGNRYNFARVDVRELREEEGTPTHDFEYAHKVTILDSELSSEHAEGVADKEFYTLARAFTAVTNAYAMKFEDGFRIISATEFEQRINKGFRDEDVA